MLTLLNSIITLAKSKHCNRLVLLIYSFALYMVGCSAFTLPIKGLLWIILWYFFYAAIINTAPLQPFYKLHFQSGKWHAYDHDNQVIIYDCLRVIIEVGLFFLIELSCEDKKRKALVFFDQITQEDYRIIRLLEKSRKSVT